LKLPPDIQIDSSANGYITIEILKKFICRNYHDVKLVISDKCTSHISNDIDKIYKERGIHHASIPSGCTKYVQPLDVSVFRSLKAFLDDEKCAWISSNIDYRTKAGNIKNPGRQEAIDWVDRAFKGISSESIEKAFKLCNLCQ